MIADETERADSYEILVVDDTSASLQLLTHILTDRGYRVRPASGGLLALRSVAAKAPDLILLDVKMPDLDGFEVCRRLKSDEWSRNIPVLFISSLDETSEKVKGFEAGGVDFITKPFEPQEVLARVGIHLRLRELAERLEKRVRARTEELTDVNLKLQQEITERKCTEEALRESEARLSITMEVGNAGTWEWNLEDDAVFLDTRFHAMLGYDPGELPNTLAEWAATYHHPDDLPVMMSRAEAYFRGDTPVYESEHRIRSKAGNWDWVFTRGRIVELTTTGRPRLFIGFAINTTERKRAEEALRESRATLGLVLDTVPQSVFWKDLEGRYLGCNRVFATAVGLDDPARIVGKTDFDLSWPVEEAEAYRADDREVLENNRPKLHIIEPLQQADGTRIWIDTSKAPLCDANGRLFAVLGVYEDITERRRAEEEREKLQAQLNQAQKMESVGRLAGGVAHDFNNMLGVILGHAELALEQVDPAQPLYADLEEIRKAATRSADLTRQLLAFARKQTVTPKILDLNEAIESMLNMLRRLIGEDIELAWLPGTSLWPVKVDPSQIDQILANLCVNARDALAGVGRITIETGNSTFDADYCALHAGFVPGEYVRLVVSDNGCGMDRETQAHIFEPFFTTKGVGEGTGLGLATVFGSVKQNNGFINVYSEPGQGTTFTIYLPWHRGLAEKMRTEGTPRPAGRGLETVLLVEDEPAILELTTTLLERLGYTVLAASTPGEAIRLAGEYTGRIHLLMTDVVMPEMNGRDLAQYLLLLYPNLKRLFMSGYTANVIAHHGVLDEGVSFIQKPFSLKDLAVKVREAFERA